MFIVGLRKLFKLKCAGEMFSITSSYHLDAVSAYEWLVCHLLHESGNKLREELSSGKDNFTARNDSQVYYCRTLSIAFIEVKIRYFLFINSQIRK